MATPISDIGMIFITNKEPMLDKNVRLAAIMAIDKKAIVDRLLRGYGVPIDTLEAPEYAAFDPSIKTPYDPEEGGRSCSPPPATRRRSRSSSRSRRPAASSPRTTR